MRHLHVGWTPTPWRVVTLPDNTQTVRANTNPATEVCVISAEVRPNRNRPTEEANASATEGELTPEDVVAAASIEIPADVQALSDAAEHALQAQRDREQAEAGADEDTPEDEPAEA